MTNFWVTALFLLMLAIVLLGGARVAIWLFHGQGRADGFARQDQWSNDEWWNK